MPTLLIMDNHLSHMNWDAIRLAIENDIILLTIPPHCTGHMQPLDTHILSPVKKQYGDLVNQWCKSHAGQKYDISLVASLGDQAVNSHATADIIILAFRKTGIYPLNPNVFTEQDFSAA